MKIVRTWTRPDGKGGSCTVFVFDVGTLTLFPDGTEVHRRSSGGLMDKAKDADFIREMSEAVKAANCG